MAKRKTTAKRKPSKSKKKSSSRTWIVFGLLLVVGISSFFAFWYEAKAKPQSAHHFFEIVPKGYKSIGIDVSHHQGEIDWNVLFDEAGFDTIIDFVYCKATEGTDHTDTQWNRNREVLNEKGILNGAYHYFLPNSDALKQAKHFLSVYQHRSIDLPPVLDVEEEVEDDDELIRNIEIWCKEVKRSTGMEPVIYTSLHFFETKFKEKLSHCKFWIAAYSREPQYMFLDNVLHWQFSETGRLPGIKNNVDLNVSNIEF